MNISSDIENLSFSFLGTEAQMKGDFSFSGKTHLRGKVFGEIHMQKNAPLIIEPSALFEGILNCFDLEVHGKLVGEIHAKGQVVFHSTAKFEGKLISSDLIVRPGAEVNMSGHFGEEAPLS